MHILWVHISHCESTTIFNEPPPRAEGHMSEAVRIGNEISDLTIRSQEPFWAEGIIVGEVFGITVHRPRRRELSATFPHTVAIAYHALYMTIDPV